MKSFFLLAIIVFSTVQAQSSLYCKSLMNKSNNFTLPFYKNNNFKVFRASKKEMNSSQKNLAQKFIEETEDALQKLKDKGFNIAQEFDIILVFDGDILSFQKTYIEEDHTSSSEHDTEGPHIHSVEKSDETISSFGVLDGDSFHKFSQDQTAFVMPIKTDQDIYNIKSTSVHELTHLSTPNPLNDLKRGSKYSLAYKAWDEARSYILDYIITGSVKTGTREFDSDISNPSIKHLTDLAKLNDEHFSGQFLAHLMYLAKTHHINFSITELIHSIDEKVITQSETGSNKFRVETLFSEDEVRNKFEKLNPLKENSSSRDLKFASLIRKGEGSRVLHHISMLKSITSLILETVYELNPGDLYKKEVIEYLHTLGMSVEELN